jgi:hypothetical protein
MWRALQLKNLVRETNGIKPHNLLAYETNFQQAASPPDHSWTPFLSLIQFLFIMDMTLK